MQIHRPRHIPLNERIQQWIEAQQMRASGPSYWWLAVFATGIATLAFSLVLQTVFPAAGANMAPGYGAPVIAFEFAREQADLIAIFGDATDPEQASRLFAMQSGNEQDYLFMLLYAAFLSSGCWALWRELRRPALLLGVVMPLLAAMFDAWENWLLFSVQAAFTLGEYSPDMETLPAPVMAKFLLLTLTNILIGYGLMQIPGRGWQLAGVLVIVPCVTVVMALISPMAFGWTLAPAIAAGWIALLVTATMASWRALLNKRPLVSFTEDMRMVVERRRTAEPVPGSVEEEGNATPIRPAVFGRRRSDTLSDPE